MILLPLIICIDLAPSLSKIISKQEQTPTFNKSPAIISQWIQTFHNSPSITVSETKEALHKFIEVSRDNDASLWTSYFKDILNIVLELFKDEQVSRIHCVHSFILLYFSNLFASYPF
jgi:hypothetical protein